MVKTVKIFRVEGENLWRTLKNGHQKIVVNSSLNMNKELNKQLGEALAQEKLAVEKQLESFATEDKNEKGNWVAKRINTQDTDLEEKADDAEEYDNLVSLENSLELKLKDVNAALEKIAAGNYGSCEKCGKEIEEGRLEVCPEAKTCMKCNENK